MLAGMGVLSVNQQHLGAGFIARWRDNDHFLANAPDAVGQYGTRQYASPLWQSSLLDSRGVTQIATGGGNYVIEVATNPRTIYGQWGGRPWPEAFYPYHPVDGYFDGRLLFYSADYTQLGVLLPNALWLWFEVGPHTRDARLTADGFVYYDEEQPKHLMLQVGETLPTPIPTVDTPLDPFSFVHRGVRWFLYRFEHTYLQREDSDEGYVFPASYGSDVYTFNLSARVGLALDAAESPEHLSVVTLPILGSGVVKLPSIHPPPTFGPFTHPVAVAVFKDPENTSGAPWEVLVNQNNQTGSRPLFVVADTVESHWSGPLLGIYEERPENIPASLHLARAVQTRFVFCHDTVADPQPITDMASCDQHWLELYLHVGETVGQSMARHSWQIDDLLSLWPGDIGVVPMFYLQGGPNDTDPTTPPEVWTISQVRQVLANLTQIVNRSPRIKVIAPFAYLRGNGIVAHPELREDFNNLLAAATAAGMPTLAPVPQPPPHPLPPDPIPNPRPPVSAIGAIYMAMIDQNEIRRLLHFGVNTLPDGKVTYTAGIWDKQGDGSYKKRDNGDVWSVQADGSLETRPRGSAGAFECFQVDEKGTATANNAGFTKGDAKGGQWTFLPVLVDKL